MKMTHPCQRRRAGFTLIELLAAIVILLVLAALMFPVAGRMRSRTKVVECISNQKQIGTALHLYAADHQGKFPPFIQGKETLNSTGSQNTLAAQLIPNKGNYLPDKKVFYDPGAVNRIYKETSTGWVNWTDTGETERSGYWHVYMSPDAFHNPQRASDDMYGANDTVRCPPYRVMMYCYYKNGSVSQGAHPYGEVNVLRLDGSVQSYTRSQYLPGKGIIENFDHKRP